MFTLPLYFELYFRSETRKAKLSLCLSKFNVMKTWGTTDASLWTHESLTSRYHINIQIKKKTALSVDRRHTATLVALLCRGSNDLFTKLSKRKWKSLSKTTTCYHSNFFTSILLYQDDKWTKCGNLLTEWFASSNEMPLISFQWWSPHIDPSTVLPNSFFSGFKRLVKHNISGFFVLAFHYNQHSKSCFKI